MNKEEQNVKKRKYNIILAICIIILIITITYLVIDCNKKIQVDSSLNIESEEENLIGNIQTVEELTKVENINSIEELQKLNEKEIEEKNSKETNSKQNINGAPYYIKVNYGAQVVTIYSKDKDGKYTNPVKAMVCSTGTYTPKSGVYKIPAKIGWCGLMGDVYGQYTTQIVGDILFHSVPYLKKGDKSSIEYWEYDKLGTKASLGCVRLTCKDAKWIYDNCQIGTQVEFYSSSNPGPLGKPSARKISDAPENIRGWDPTDPSSNNPWKDYLKSGNSDNNKNEISNNIQNEVNEIENNIINNDIGYNAVVENKVENDIINDTYNDTIINDTASNEVINSETVNIINNI